MKNIVPKNIQDRLILFERNIKWIDVDFSYLKWVIENYEESPSRYKNALESFKYKIKHIDLNEYDLEIFNKSIPFGKHYGTKWIGI